MFAKLLKHEWKANGGLLSILSLCALGAGLLGAFTLKGILYIEKQYSQEDVAVLGTMGLASALTFIIVALVAYAFAVQFITLFRFYKSKFTDEGYLTFTLPVKVHQIFLSSFLHILAWLAVSAVVLIGAVSIIIFIGASESLEAHAWQIRAFLESFGGLWEEELLSEPGYRLYSVLNIASVVITPVYSVLLMMTSITVGCVLAKKYKILAIIGSYYVINFAVGILESILGVVLLIPLGVAEADPETCIYVYMSAPMIANLLLRIGLGIGGYFLSTSLMKNKLNLP